MGTYYNKINGVIKTAKQKPWYQSKTFYAGAIVFVCGGLKAIGIEVIPTEAILMMLGLEGYFIRCRMKK